MIINKIFNKKIIRFKILIKKKLIVEKKIDKEIWLKNFGKNKNLNKYKIRII